MTVRALLVAPKRSSVGMAIDQVVEFAVLPRIGETVDIGVEGVALTIRVTNIVHMPYHGNLLPDDGDGIHIWGEVLEHGYQY